VNAIVPKTSTLRSIGKTGFEKLSEFRWELRRFLRFSEDAAREAGITVLQYQLMLHTQGFPDRDWATISELAERLQAQHHGVVALVSRCEEAGLVRRRQHQDDRRQVEVHLLAKGRKLLELLGSRHDAELDRLAQVLGRNGESGAGD
jgi:DNA-binding MarR family transcriptional regulator